MAPVSPKGENPKIPKAAVETLGLERRTQDRCLKRFSSEAPGHQALRVPPLLRPGRPADPGADGAPRAVHAETHPTSLTVPQGAESHGPTSHTSDF